MPGMRRRDVVALLGRAAAAWPLVAQVHQRSWIRTITVQVIAREALINAAMRSFAA